MEIRNINNTPKFTGIYRFPNVDAKTVANISEHMTFFAGVTRSPVYMFAGKHPLEAKVVEVITETVPECKQYSYDWLVQNAKNFGLTLPTSGNVDAWVFTNKEVSLIKECCEKFDSILKGKKSFWSSLKSLFVVSDTPKKRLPSHLKELEELVSTNEKMVEIFQQVIQDKKVVKVDSLHNLIFSVSTKG
ncbi:hypothetical protein IKL64_05195 [bacterium]|nr:hypothetical protein [bacterium]